MLNYLSMLPATVILEPKRPEQKKPDFLNFRSLKLLISRSLILVHWSSRFTCMYRIFSYFSNIYVRLCPYQNLPSCLVHQFYKNQGRYHKLNRLRKMMLFSYIKNISLSLIFDFQKIIFDWHPLGNSRICQNLWFYATHAYLS